MRLVHVAAPPRNDGSQFCSRCGLELTPATDPNQWPVDCLVEIATDDGVVSTRVLESEPIDELSMCLGPLDGAQETPESSTK